jgi:hypothetical protein
MRLRPLTEAECYARCYGGRGNERVNVVPQLPRATQRGEELRERFKDRLDRRGPEVEAA